MQRLLMVIFLLTALTACASEGTTADADRAGFCKDEATNKAGGSPVQYRVLFNQCMDKK
jgi:hypothetical protein